MVEINLTSNEMILGVSGKHHPLLMYRMFGVPTALSTDDEGVSRIDLTNEYVRAVETYGFKYAGFEKNGTDRTRACVFAGKSLWEKQDNFARRRERVRERSARKTKSRQTLQGILGANAKSATAMGTRETIPQL